MKKRLLFLSLSVLAIAAVVTVKSVNTKSGMSSLMTQNIEALTQNEGGGGNSYKLTVCYCSENAPTDGYYDWAKMKNHCHIGLGNSCANAYYCRYTWYCNL